MSKKQQQRDSDYQGTRRGDLKLDNTISIPKDASRTREMMKAPDVNDDTTYNDQNLGLPTNGRPISGATYPQQRLLPFRSQENRHSTASSLANTRSLEARGFSYSFKKVGKRSSSIPSASIARAAAQSSNGELLGRSTIGAAGERASLNRVSSDDTNTVYNNIETQQDETVPLPNTAAMERHIFDGNDCVMQSFPPPPPLPSAVVNLARVRRFLPSAGSMYTQENNVLLLPNKEIESNKFVARPNMFDVLSGRGRQIQNNLGNVLLRRIVDRHMNDYNRQPRTNRRPIVKAIVDAFHANGNRFLCKVVLDTPNHGPSMFDGGWKTIGREEALEKVFH